MAGEPPLPLTPSPSSGGSGDTHLPTSCVLVVDDNVQNVELMQAYLETLNCTVHTAADGSEALAKVPQVKPDLILLDIMMPRMSGFEVCRRLKADPKTRDIPILMVTALNELGDIERGVESGQVAAAGAAPEGGAGSDDGLFERDGEPAGKRVGAWPGAANELKHEDTKK